MQQTFPIYADPGHAWAKVHVSVLEELGLTTEHFSSYSYRMGDYIYLEEDGDLLHFTEVYETKTGNLPRWRENHCNGKSRIRSYFANTPGQAYRDWYESRYGKTQA